MAREQEWEANYLGHGATGEKSVELRAAAGRRDDAADREGGGGHEDGRDKHGAHLSARSEKKQRTSQAGFLTEAETLSSQSPHAHPGSSTWRAR